MRMNTKDIHELTERFLNGETTLEEEHLLYNYYGRQDVDKSLQPYTSLFRGLAKAAQSSPQTSAPFLQPSRAIPLWLKVWRMASTTAAIFLLGILVTTNLRQPAALPQTSSVQQPSVVLPECSSGSTLREKALCYILQREAHRSIYKKLKQQYNERH